MVILASGGSEATQTTELPPAHFTHALGSVEGTRIVGCQCERCGEIRREGPPQLRSPLGRILENAAGRVVHQDDFDGLSDEDRKRLARNAARKAARAKERQRKESRITLTDRMSLFLRHVNQRPAA